MPKFGVNEKAAEARGKKEAAKKAAAAAAEKKKASCASLHAALLSAATPCRLQVAKIFTSRSRERPCSPSAVHPWHATLSASSCPARRVGLRLLCPHPCRCAGGRLLVQA